ncbi:MAG: Methyltransferase [uncultured bacterium]|nr:MAG: Methyltransferase [uncultured bacterium]
MHKIKKLIFKLFGLSIDLQMSDILKLFPTKDFKLSKLANNKHQLIFNNDLGYHRPNYSPIFYYQNKRWQVEVDGITFQTKSNPCFELISELRGYTLLDNVGNDDIVIDVGASTGLIGCYFAKKIGNSGKVIALEPDVRFRTILETHIKYNNLDNIKVIRKGLYNKCTKISFDLLDMGASRIESDPDNQNKAESKEIETIDICTLVNYLNLDTSKIKLIKMDIEGTEVDIVEDIALFIEKNINTVACIASYHKINGIPAYKIIEDKCRNSDKIFTKTVYPYHPSTFIINNLNSAGINKLQEIPQYLEV